MPLFSCTVPQVSFSSDLSKILEPAIAYGNDSLFQKNSGIWALETHTFILNCVRMSIRVRNIHNNPVSPRCTIQEDVCATHRIGGCLCLGYSVKTDDHRGHGGHIRLSGSPGKEDRDPGISGDGILRDLEDNLLERRDTIGWFWLEVRRWEGDCGWYGGGDGSRGRGTRLVTASSYQENGDASEQKRDANFHNALSPTSVKRFPLPLHHKVSLSI